MEHDEVYQKRDIMMARMDENLQHLVRWSKDHTVDDDLRFKDIKRDIETGKKFLYGALGAILLIEFFTKFIK